MAPRMPWDGLFAFKAWSWRHGSDAVEARTTIPPEVMPPIGNVPDIVLEEFVAACHRAAGHGLMRCSSGNLSLRADNGLMLATVSRSWASTLTREQVTVCRIADGAVIQGGKPTVEIGFHAGVLRRRPGTNVVMHFQTPAATTLACRGAGEINYNVIPEIPFYLGPVARVPFLLPGTKDLADAVTAALADHDMVQMAGHGQVTVARDVDHAIQNAEFFELACEIILRGGENVTPLSEQDVANLLALRQREAGEGV